MRDHKQRAARLLEIPLQKLYNVDVEVVRRLVHDQKVGLLQQHRGYGGAFGLASRELAHLLVEARQLQRREHLPHPLFGIPACCGVHRRHGPLDASAILRDDGPLVFADDATRLPKTRIYFVEERALGIEIGMLVEECHAQVAHETHLAAAVRRVDPREDLQQRALARTVGGYEGDLVPLVYVETDVAEEYAVAV